MAGYLLDTNVVSELIEARPDRNVVAWMEGQVADDLHLSAMTISELTRGVRRLAIGKTRTAYQNWIDKDLAAQFEGRILPFDREAAVIWGEIMGDGDKKGRPKPSADAQIAATARRYDLALVTRNTKDFRGMAVRLLNPWSEAVG